MQLLKARLWSQSEPIEMHDKRKASVATDSIALSRHARACTAPSGVNVNIDHFRRFSSIFGEIFFYFYLKSYAVIQFLYQLAVILEKNTKFLGENIFNRPPGTDVII
jgi:hypothetical protein